jgi:hypothetical protein
MGSVTYQIREEKEVVSRKECRKNFCGAIAGCVVDIKAEKNKFSRYTNMVYESIFRETSDECREILRLSKKDRLRDSLHESVLDLVAAYEFGLADAINKEHNRLGRLLWKRDVDRVIAKFEKMPHWVPLIQKARAEMGLRDISEKGALHPKLIHVNWGGQ